MKILRVAQAIDDHVFSLSRSQSERGHDVTIIRPCGADEQPGKFHRDGYRLIRKPTSVEILGNKFSVGVASFLANTTNYDVIHAHSHLFFSTNIASAVGHLKDTPLAITNHGIHSQSVPEWFSRAYLRTLGRWTYNWADLIFCYSSIDERRLRKFGIHPEIEVIHNGIDTSQFTPNGPASELIDHDQPVVLFAGRLVDGKRPLDAIKAIERIGNSHLNVQLYICGDGPNRSQLQRYVINRGLLDDVHFLGQVSSDEMPKVYRSADVLLLTSRAEGFPRVVLEAMASGIPVITSDLPQLRQFVQEAGYTVGIGDINGYADRLERLLSSEESRTMLGERGREIVVSNFRWEQLVSRTTDALARITN